MAARAERARESARQDYGNVGQERAAAALLHEKRQVDTRVRY